MTPPLTYFSILQETRFSGIQKTFHRGKHKKWTIWRWIFKTGCIGDVIQASSLGHTAIIYMNPAVPVGKRSLQLDLLATDLPLEEEQGPSLQYSPM